MWPSTTTSLGRAWSSEPTTPRTETRAGFSNAEPVVEEDLSFAGLHELDAEALVGDHDLHGGGHPRHHAFPG